MEFYLPASPRTSTPRGGSWDPRTRTTEDEHLLLHQRALAPALPKWGSGPGKASAHTSLSRGGPSGHPRPTQHVILHPLLCSPYTRTNIHFIAACPTRQPVPRGKGWLCRCQAPARRRHFEIRPVYTTRKPVSGKRHRSSRSRRLVSPQAVKTAPPTEHSPKISSMRLGSFLEDCVSWPPKPLLSSL